MRMRSWNVTLDGLGVPCGCPYEADECRLTHAFSAWGAEVDQAECVRCGATWDEWDDIGWRDWVELREAL